jgi:hypothetical protein
VEYRDTANDRVCEIHDEIEWFIGCEIYRIHPFRPAQGRSRPSVDKTMHLMDVKRMNLVCCVRNTPMRVGPYLCPSHRLVILGKPPVVQVETLLILAKLHSKDGGTPLQLISYACVTALYFAPIASNDQNGFQDET